MKKLPLVMALGMTMVTGSVFAADQGHGSVTFKGEIIDAPCSITADSVDQTVDLGQISSSALKAGGTSSPKSFSIKLEDCTFTTEQSVTATFTGKAAAFDSTSSVLALSGTASGAGVVITDDGSNKIKLGEASTSYVINANQTDAELLFAAYVQGATDNTAYPIVAGDFTSVANFTLAYQ